MISIRVVIVLDVGEQSSQCLEEKGARLTGKITQIKAENPKAGWVLDRRRSKKSLAQTNFR